MLETKLSCRHLRTGRRPLRTTGLSGMKEDQESLNSCRSWTCVGSMVRWWWHQWHFMKSAIYWIQPGVCHTWMRCDRDKNPTGREINPEFYSTCRWQRESDEGGIMEKRGEVRVCGSRGREGQWLDFNQTKWEIGLSTCRNRGHLGEKYLGFKKTLGGGGGGLETI